jgi:hypothetical protein
MLALVTCYSTTCRQQLFQSTTAEQRTAYLRMQVFSIMYFCIVGQRLCQIMAACVQLHVPQSVAFALPLSVISASQRS